MNYKLHILLGTLILSGALCFGQGSSLSSKLNLRFAPLHMGSYMKEPPIVGLDYQLDYSFTEELQAGVGIGGYMFPNAVSIPIDIHAIYNFGSDKVWFVEQSVGYQLKLGEFFLKSSRNLGCVGRKFGKKYSGELGYLYFWDKYGGKELSFFGGVSLLIRTKSGEE